MKILISGRNFPICLTMIVTNMSLLQNLGKVVWVREGREDVNGSKNWKSIVLDLWTIEEVPHFPFTSD